MSKSSFSPHNQMVINKNVWFSGCNHQTAFTNKKDFGKESREAAWATEQRTLHGLQTPEGKTYLERSNFRDLNLMADEARRRAEIARLVFSIKFGFSYSVCCS